MKIVFLLIAKATSQTEMKYSRRKQADQASPPSCSYALAFNNANNLSARRWATGATATTVVVLDTTSLVQSGSSVDALGQGRVDTERQPAEQAVLNSVAEQDVLNEGVAGGGLLLEDAVVLVEGEGLRVGGVDGRGLNLVDEVLVEEDLPDVRGRRVEEGAVIAGGGVQVHHHVDVGRAASVVAREQRVEAGNSVGVGRLDATREGRVQVGGVAGRVAVAVGGDARIDAGGVASYGTRLASRLSSKPADL